MNANDESMKTMAPMMNLILPRTTPYAQKLADFDAAILAYEDVLADYRRAQKRSGDGNCSVQQVEEAQEEVAAARMTFDAAERALNS